MSFPNGSEREESIYAARRELVLAALDLITDRYKQPGTYVVRTDRLDDAAKALADELRKPETCFACHQEVKK